MRRLTVIVPAEVRHQITTQVVHIAADSVDNALAWDRRVRAYIESLGDAHGHAVDIDGTLRVGFPVRKAVFERTYLIHYFVDERADAVLVVSFRHGARLPNPGEP